MILRLDELALDLPKPKNPSANDDAFPEAKAFMKHGLHRELYTFSPNAYMEAGVIWNGKHSEDGSELEVIQGAKRACPTPFWNKSPS